MEKVLKLFLDTEFTDFVNPELLSIGIVDELGNHFYGEIHYEKQLNWFVTEHVVSQWGKIPNSLYLDNEMLSRHLIKWLSNYTETLEICYDYHTDADLFCNLVGEQLNFIYSNISYLNGSVYELAARKEWARIEKEMGISRHHALADAYALRATYREAHEKP